MTVALAFSLTGVVLFGSLANVCAAVWRIKQEEQS